MAAITFADSPLACIRCARADFDLSSASGLPMCWPRARHLLRRDSGWRDLNPRPLRPERRHLSVCRPGAALELLKTAGYSVEVGYVQRGGHETLRGAVGAYVGALGITIGVAFWRPLFIMSFGGQDKSAGGQFVFALDRAYPSLGLPTFVTSLLFVLLLLLSAHATPGGASETTTATRVATTATRRLLLIALCQCCCLP